MHTLMLGDHGCKLLVWCQKLLVSMTLFTVLLAVLNQDRCCRLPLTMMACNCGWDNHVSSGLSFIVLEFASILQKLADGSPGRCEQPHLQPEL